MNKNSYGPKTHIVRQAPCRLILTEDEYQELHDYIDACRLCNNQIKKTIWDAFFKNYNVMDNLVIRDIIMNRPKAQSYDFLTDGEKVHLPRVCQWLFDKFNIPLGTSKKDRLNIANICGKQCVAVKERFKKEKIKNAPIVKYGKSFMAYESIFRIQNNTLSMRILGKTLQAKMHPFGYHAAVVDKIQKADVGGTLKCQGGNATLRVTVYPEWKAKYVPTTSLGIDINKTAADWLCISCNNGSSHEIIARPEFIDGLLAEQSRLNTAVKKDDLLDRKTRRLLRIEKKEVERKIRLAVEPFAEYIIALAVCQNSLVCIDDARTGATTCEYGQAISSVLLKKCEKYNIPHVLVKCAFTSRMCSKCNNTHPKNRINTLEFKCTNCGHKDNAQLQAATNVGAKGWANYHIEDKIKELSPIIPRLPNEKHGGYAKRLQLELNKKYVTEKNVPIAYYSYDVIKDYLSS